MITSLNYNTVPKNPTDLHFVTYKNVNLLVQRAQLVEMLLLVEDTYRVSHLFCNPKKEQRININCYFTEVLKRLQKVVEQVSRHSLFEDGPRFA